MSEKDIVHVIQTIFVLYLATTIHIGQNTYLNYFIQELWVN